MQQNNSKKRLGRGLAALIGNEYNAVTSNEAIIDNSHQTDLLISIDKIKANKINPRTDFAEEDIDSLASSIKNYGVIQPVIVYKINDDEYQLIAGERRWRAAKKAGLSKIPAIIKNVEKEEILELAIIENIQRTDLNAIEEALGYQQLIAQYGYSQEKLAEKMSKSRPYIANSLRLLNLPIEIQNLLKEKKLTVGHARCLINHPLALELAEKIIKEQLSVRETEKEILLLEKEENNKVKINEKNDELDYYYKKLEDELRKQTKLYVKLKGDEKGGSLIIKFKNSEELENICNKFK